jgi:hypothetical protein
LVAGTVGTVEGHGMTEEVAGGVVDASVLGQVLAPRFDHEHLGELLRLAHVSIQAPAAGAGRQAHQAHPLHHLHEIG